MKKTIYTLLLLFAVTAISAQSGFNKVELDSTRKTLTQFSYFTSDVSFDNYDNVWIATGKKYALTNPNFRAYGIIKHNKTSVKLYNQGNSALQSNEVYSVLADGNILWVGTHLGLQRFDIKGDLNTTKSYNNLSIKGLGKKVLKIKKIGFYLFICTDNGYGRLDTRNDQFVHYDGSLWSSPNAKVYDLIAANGAVWLATDGGLVKKAGNSYTVYNTNTSGLLNNNLYTLLWDDKTKSLWIGGDGGKKTNTNYLGLSVLRNNIISPVEEVIDCSFKKVLGTKGRIFHLEKEKNSNDILVSLGFSGSSHPNTKLPTFLKIKSSTQLVGYFIEDIFQGNTKEIVKTSELYPFYLKNNPNGGLWLGVNNRSPVYYEIYDSEKIVNDGGSSLKTISGIAPENLDINQVSALILSRGDMFWDLNRASRYEVPKNTCKSPVFAGSIWMGGVDQGNKLHTAAMTYRQSGSDYFPGPIDTTGTAPPNFYGDSNFHKIWKINKWDIEEFKKAYNNGSLQNGTHKIPDDFLTWPAHGKGNYTYYLAPFVDVDNNGKYEPKKGDYPKIKGDQALFWIFNDARGIHTETQGLPLGVEVKAMAYAYNCDSIKKGSPNEALNYTTFYEYEIVNRSVNKYDGTYFGVWTDVDLGNYADDYIGSDPQNNFAFVYNGDNDDEGVMGYGKNPPMLSVVMLSDKMSNFMSYTNDFSVLGNPTLASHYYGYLRSIWKDGSPLTYGGNGYLTGSITSYAYSGTPYTTGAWNEAEAGNTKGDRRFLQSVGPYTFEPNETKKLEYAIVYSHEPSAPNGLNTSWAKNLRDVKAIQGWYNNQNFPSCPTKPIGVSIGAEIENPLQEIKVVPNPFNGNTSLVFNLSKETKGTIQVYNMLGQVVQNIPLTRFNSGENTVSIDIANQPTGMYMYLLKTEGGQYTGKMINAVR